MQVILTADRNAETLCALWAPAPNLHMLHPLPSTYIMPTKSKPPTMICPLLESCTDEHCPKKHDGYRCICGAIMVKRSIKSHLAGKKHNKYTRKLSEVPAPPAVVTASILQAPPIGTSGLLRTPVAQASDGFTHCDCCDKDIPSFRWHFHLDHQDHLKALKIATIQTSLNHAAEDKNGIKVSGELDGLDFGVVEAGFTPGLPLTRSLTIQKTENESRVDLVDFKFTSLGLTSTSR